MKPEISVIVPVYNVEPYLKRCLDSIINQSMKDIEILIIDDGSTDKSGEICEEYAGLDNRIKVTHQNNHGLSYARNTGLDQAQGKYIMFVDSDDYVERDFCKIPYEIAEKNDAEIVIFHHHTFEKNKEIQKSNANISQGPKTKQEAIDLIQHISEHCVWNKMFRSTLFDSIRFPDGYYEDIGIVYKLILASNSIYYCKDMLYNYVRRDNSISSSLNSKKKLDLLNMCYKAYKDINGAGYNYVTYSSVVSLCFRYIAFFGFDSDFSNECMDIIENHRHAPILKPKAKVCYLLYDLNSRLFYFMFFPLRLFLKF